MTADRDQQDLSSLAWASPTIPTVCREFVGREMQLRLCRAAWGLDAEGNPLGDQSMALPFRLEGPPGTGKNEIVYRIATEMSRPFYSIQGHGEMTPEDLTIVMVPDPRGGLMLRASPLATALYEGGVFFFDEISRVPERALAPLASLLDSRRSLYSAMTSIEIRPKDEEARRNFRFCCALNPGASESGRGVLPDYIAERTLPVIAVPYLQGEELLQAVRLNVPDDEPIFDAFRLWYNDKARREISTRKAITMVQFALNILRNRSGVEPEKAILEAEAATMDDSTPNRRIDD